MDAAKFQEVMDAQFRMCQSILGDKAAEYATDFDRLRNFKVAAALQGVSTRQALGGMLAKHIASIYDLINFPELAHTAKWDEKLTDAMNYLILLRALVVEERDQKVSSTDAP